MLIAICANIYIFHYESKRKMNIMASMGKVVDYDKFYL
jgi:hypothetical protein